MLNKQFTNHIVAVEATDVTDSVLMHQPRARGICARRPEMLHQIIVYMMNRIHLAGMARRRISNVEIHGIARPRELDENLVCGVILMIPPVHLTLTEPISPVHSAKLSLDFDGFAVVPE